MCVDDRHRLLIPRADEIADMAIPGRPRRCRAGEIDELVFFQDRQKSRGQSRRLCFEGVCVIDLVERRQPRVVRANRKEMSHAYQSDDGVWSRGNSLRENEITIAGPFCFAPLAWLDEAAVSIDRAHQRPEASSWPGSGAGGGALAPISPTCLGAQWRPLIVVRRPTAGNSGEHFYGRRIFFLFFCTLLKRAGRDDGGLTRQARQKGRSLRRSLKAIAGFDRRHPPAPVEVVKPDDGKRLQQR